MTKPKDNSKRNRFLIIFLILTIFGFGITATIFTTSETNNNYSLDGIRNEIKDSIKVSELNGTTSRWVRKNATESELLKLTEYPNGIVKAIAYEGLLRKKEFAQKTELIFRAINDTTYIIDNQSRCVMNVNIGEYIVQNVLLIDDEIPIPEKLPDFGLTKIEKEKILTEFRKLRVKKKANKMF